MSDLVRYVVGLGNPGRQYERTRHNVGFRVLDVLRRRWLAGPGRSAFQGRLDDVRVERAGQRVRVLMLEPHTYMNRSGQAVRQLVDFYKVDDLSGLLVVLDDLALDVGRLRLRGDGSPGGHNGLADVLARLGTTQVPRLRIGIGAKPPLMDQADYVLSAFAADEEECIGPVVQRAAQAVEDWLFLGLTRTMETYNAKGQES